MNEIEISRKIDELKADRDRLYRTVQDFTVSSNKTDRVMSQLKELTAEITKLEKSIKKKSIQSGAQDFADRKKKFLNS